jgi:hypothetical protein
MSNKKLSPSDLKILRKKAVEAIVVHGISKKQASITFGFSRSSIWKYLKEYKIYKEESFRYRPIGNIAAKIPIKELYEQSVKCL